ncbi:UDP-3-O-acyl-N-acetylglucosamine deacetylase [Nereida ignava]|uniref:UDP-3-O-acyl-N-acetylglucosamine deacetylase n=1 Tax=Nereida ignava TaxID=282199 RepID=A0A0U1NIM9_9RHOB|nr:UDP-3-O-acyl-N-acetylglucosamine deacetylase [Nereida ignava]CRK74572.1 UDP-3-O-[3-hydroxymyristoyl] N-acetylglucosamine deacetylase [Nereida ignava]SFJ17748.1 UDP-3-O-[3-hydroxymyristoyl] N-acetylglucosamine deacetylase [Nereida ignava DSM 16309]
MQTTLRTPVTFTGTGLHSGRAVRMTVAPASTNYGIWFRRTDVASSKDNLIPATWDRVEISPLCTLLVNDAGVTVSTVEHVMAALTGCGIHNAMIEIDGGEVPILDGSSVTFAQSFLNAGVQTLGAPLQAIRILKDIEVTVDGATASLSPSDALEIDFSIDFADGAIGRQRKHLNLRNGTFVRELSDSRTFCRQSDVDAMRSNGLALGGTLTNAVVVDGDAVLSPGGFRHADEAVRHKMLDALGDLSLAGHPILGRYTGVRAGHAMTNRLLRALFADPSAFEVVTCTPEMASGLPGAGVEVLDLPQAC